MVQHRARWPSRPPSQETVSFISPFGLPYDMDLGEYKLLHHWNSYLSPSLSVGPKDQINPFQMHLTAMAFDKSPLRYIVLSMASRHIAVLLGQPGLEIAAQRYQHRAIQLLSSVLDHPHESCSDSTLASVLLMQISALFAGDDEPRVNHLAGARSIIVQRGGPAACSESCSRFLLSLFSYHGVISSISKAQRSLLDYDYLPAVDVDGLMGCTAPVLRFVSRISALQSLKKATRQESDATSSSSQARLIELGSAIERDLIAWEVPQSEPEWEQTAEAYRYAALIYLNRTVYGIGAPHPLTLQYVRQCLDSLSLVPADSPVTSIHAWPLFTAGCEAINIVDRAFARQRFRDMYDLRSMPSLLRVSRTMENVWATKDQEAIDQVKMMCTKDCIQIIKSGGKEIDIV